MLLQGRRGLHMLLQGRRGLHMLLQGRRGLHVLLQGRRGLHMLLQGRSGLYMLLQGRRGLHSPPPTISRRHLHWLPLHSSHGIKARAPPLASPPQLIWDQG